MEDSFSIVFYESYFNALFSIDDYKARSDLLQGIYSFIKTGKEPKLTGQAKSCFILMRPILEKSKKNFISKKRVGNPNFKKGQANPYYKQDKKEIIDGELSPELSPELSNNYLLSQGGEKEENSDNYDNSDNNYANSNSNSNGNSNSKNKYKINQKEECSAENEGNLGESLDENAVFSAENGENGVEKLKNVLKSSKNSEINNLDEVNDMDYVSFQDFADKGAKNIFKSGPAKEDSEKMWVMRDKIPPTFEEVKKYIEDYNLIVDPEVFYNFYESKGWMIGKSPMVSYRAALRSWQKTAEAKQRESERIKSVYKAYSDQRKYTKEELDSVFDDLSSIDFDDD